MDLLYAAHSHWRWIVLGLVLITSLKLLASRFAGRGGGDVDAKLVLVSRIAMHVQVAMGLVLYLVLGWWSDMRFTGEHVLIALAAVGAIEVAAARSKRSPDPQAGVASASTGFLIGLGLVAVVILLRML
jgi:heme/copper-type cytochrome/quinol oxidase subunit 4